MKYIVVITREDLENKFDCVLENKIYNELVDAQRAIVNCSNEIIQ